MLKLLMSAFAIQVLVKLSESNPSVVKRSVIDEGSHYIICSQAPIDLGFVVDSSSSIPHKDFQIAIKFIQDFLGHFDVGSGREGVRVAIITYGKGIYPEDSFNLTTYSTKEEVIGAVGNIPHRAGLYTDTGKAIQYMHEVQMAPEVVRPWAEKIVIVLTDGNSQNWRFTWDQAAKTRNDGIVILAVGVGRGVRQEELENIAGNKSMVTRVDTYDQLSSIQKTLASKTCIKKEKPTTTPEPKSFCGDLEPTDINFVFSQGSLGPEITSWVTSFISETISSEDTIVGFQFGAISGSCPDDEGFNLNAYTTVEEYRNRLDQYGANHLPQLVETLVSEGFSSERGGRSDARQVAVIVVSPDDTEDELQQQVAELVANGVLVFIADPTESGFTVDGAITLTGKSARLQSLALLSQLCPE